MFTPINGRLTPYGAFELKASYQRNVLVGQLVLLTLLTLCLTGPTAYRAMFGDTMIQITVSDDHKGVEIRKTLRQQTSVNRTEPPTGPTPPPPQNQEVSNQVVALPDSSWSDDQVEDQLPTQSDLLDLNGVGDIGTSGLGFDTSSLNTDDYIPDVDEFVPVEVQPELINYVTPDYPPMARASGTTGKVVIKAFVDKDGKVIDARVYVSSGSAMLDDAAVRAAFKNTFKPGIQNGIPVRCWVAYPVAFRLDH